MGQCYSYKRFDSRLEHPLDVHVVHARHLLRRPLLLTVLTGPAAPGRAPARHPRQVSRTRTRACRDTGLGRLSEMQRGYGARDDVIKVVAPIGLDFSLGDEHSGAGRRGGPHGEGEGERAEVEAAQARRGKGRCDGRHGLIKALDRAVSASADLPPEAS